MRVHPAVPDAPDPVVRRDDSFDHNSHVAKTTWAGLRADIVAAAGYLHDHAARRTGGVAASRPPAIFVTGFCMGGRNAFLSATLGLGLSGVIGFYGFPGGTFGNGAPAPTDTVAQFDCPVLGIFGGADQNIPIAMIQSFRDALTAAGVEHDIATSDRLLRDARTREVERAAIAGPRGFGSPVLRMQRPNARHQPGWADLDPIAHSRRS